MKSKHCPSLLKCTEPTVLYSCITANLSHGAAQRLTGEENTVELSSSNLSSYTQLCEHEAALYCKRASVTSQSSLDK